MIWTLRSELQNGRDVLNNELTLDEIIELFPILFQARNPLAYRKSTLTLKKPKL